MKTTIVYDNTSSQNNLLADWGFSCMIETGNRKILFDTGGNGKILLDNLNKLNINPKSIDDIIISHPHFDHIGGLSHFLNLNHHAIVHVPLSFRGIKYANKVIFYDKPTQIYNGIYISGELDSIEQSLAIQTKEGLALVIGCGHPGVEKIMKSFSAFGNIVYILGGLHGFDDYKLLEKIKKVCPTHCTQQQEKIKALYTDKYLEGGVGRIIQF